MVALSSIFSWPFALPSLPSISLPANIQRRFLSYVLKRALGRFVKTGGLDVDRIQAQISEGWVGIEDLEVDTDAINALLPPSIPLTLTAGRLGHISAKVPFPNLWSAPLSITLDDLTLDVDLLDLSSKGKSPVQPTSSRPSQASPSIDLAESVTSAADEFLHQELDAYEEAELDRSIRQSIVLSQNDPFKADEVPGGFPFAAGGSGDSTSPLSPDVESKTALAGLVERVLARLQIKVRNVRLRIRCNDRDHPATFELRIGEILYADESSAGEADARKVVRVLRFSLLSVYMVPYAPPSSTNGRPRFPSSTRSSSTSSTSSDNGRADLAMSFAVADLRQSTMSSVASGASVYQSALEEGIPEEDESESSLRGGRSHTPTGESRGTEQLLVSFGSEDIVIKLATVTSASNHPDTSDGGPGRPRLQPQTTQQVNATLPLMEVNIGIGAVSAILLPAQIASLLAAAQMGAQASSPSPNAAPAFTLAQRQPRVESKLRIRGIYIAIIYDMAVEATDYGDLRTSIDQFWTRPSSTYLPVGHLKLRIEGISGSYRSKGYVPVPAAPSRRPTNPSLNRRPSHNAHFGPPPIVEMSLNELSIFEYLACDSATSADDPNDTIPGGAYPVLVFDWNLPKQYDLRPSAMPSMARQPVTLVPPPLFPEYDTVDWRNSGLQKRGGAGEKVWRVRPKLRSAMKGVVPQFAQEDEPVIAVYAQLPGANAHTPQVKLLPLHVFLDLSLLERLLPLLRYIAPSVRPAPAERDVLADLGRRRAAGLPAGGLSGQYVIDDLDAQAASVSTLRAEPTRSHHVELVCSMVRIDIRCPAPINRRGSWGDGAHLRSGIVTLDLRGIRARIGSGAVGTTRSVQEAAKVDWDRMILFFCRVPDKRAQAFLLMGPLSPDPADPPDMVPLRPSISMGGSKSTASVESITTVTCRIPSIQANIRQTTIEGLQFFADDITHWLDGAFGDGSGPIPRDDLKMIGSRFFGSKGSSSASSSAEEEDEGCAAGTMICVQISEMDIALHVPRKKSAGGAGDERVLSLRASDLDIKVESNMGGQQGTAVVLDVMDADFCDRTTPSTPVKILGRITPLALSMHNSPLISLRLSSTTDPASGGKESGVKITLAKLAVYITKDLAWTTDLASFAKTPEGVFEDMMPAEVTRISLQLYDCSIHIAAPTVPGGIVLVLGVLHVETNLISDAEESVLDLSLTNSDVLAIDDLAVAAALEPGRSSSSEAWTRAGYAQMIAVDPLEVQLLRDLTGSKEVLLDVVRTNVRVTACADSLVAFASLIGDLPNLAPAKPARDSTPQRAPAELDQSINVFGSIDEDTFKRIPDPISEMDLMVDDLPNNLDYLDATASRRRNDMNRTGSGEGLRSWETEHDDLLLVRDLKAEINGETIKIIVQEPIDLREEYWDTLPTQDSGLSVPAAGTIRVRVHDAAVGILLHDGYDWQRTRKTIEEEVKAVRRRLERIRQLLASGQKADDSVERTSSMLFNSIYIGLDQSKEHMDTAALLAAIDDELEELGDETASQSSWQTLPAGGSERPAPKKTRLRGKRLTRSKKAQIEIAVSGLNADIDLYGSLDPTAARLHITARTAEILDHIKTSTWKKFLSEMRADSRGNIRETGADMLRFELLQVRPSLPHPDEELRLRIKALPLRLHIDQDALDFLKRFFSFQLPPASTPADTAAAQITTPKAKELFFQHVEIFPVEIKLDYKPKRVDFAALREGRTIELMNFFHFDGAEMTLRHITLSGISGLTRLSSLLQDIWTPDVKANQLADVISGVSPIRSMVNVGSGVADLILLPIEQYRKDGRVARGVQRGTNSFVRSTAMEMMKLGAKLATGTQVILERAEGVLGGGSKFREDVVGEVNPSPASRAMESSDDEGELVDVVSRYANQPTDAREGVQAAYKSLSTNINSAAQTILAVPMEVYERSGDNGPLKAVVRAVPIAVLRPMIGASEAVSKTLLGVRNSLDPRTREELGDKYK